MADDLEAELEPLLTVTPGEFVSTRNALVKTLRAAGRKDDAAAVAALRRPSVVDWALNTVASDSPDVVDSVAQAATRLRQAQEAVLGDAGDAGGPDLREAMSRVRGTAAELRAAAEKVLRTSGRPASDLGALTTRVNEVAVSDALVEQLRGSRLGMTDVGADATDPFAAMADVAPARPRPRSATKTPTSRKAPTASREDDHTQREAEAHARAEAAAARRERERARAAATKAVESAARTLARLERQAREADARLADAQEAAEAAHRAARAAHHDLEAAEGALADVT